MERDPSFARNLLLHMDLSETLRSTEIAVWLIFVLMLISHLSAYAQMRKNKAAETKKASEWSVLVESAYDHGRYDDALQTLATTEPLFPRSATVRFWQGRCHFQLEEWEKAANRFQECCRLEPTIVSP